MWDPTHKVDFLYFRAFEGPLGHWAAKCPMEKHARHCKDIFFIIHILRPRVSISHQIDFDLKPFAEIHFYTDPDIRANVIFFCFRASVMEPA
jgi:hypothetical protein